MCLRRGSPSAIAPTRFVLPTTVLEAGDTVAVLGRTEALINLLSSSSVEATDPELLEIPVAAYGLYVTSNKIAGKTLREMVEGIDEARGVLLRGITRGGQSIPIGPGTTVGIPFAAQLGIRLAF